MKYTAVKIPPVNRAVRRVYGDVLPGSVWREAD